MWDFSWLERPEYDDWDKSLDELLERGYNALRIECYPAIFPDTKVIDPIWTSNDWGSPKPIQVESLKLLDFLAKCADRDIKVGLSTWWRGFQYKYDFYTAWTTVLDTIKDFKDTILFVDLTNEFPMDLWTHHPCGNSDEEKFEWADNMLLKFKERYDYEFCFNTHVRFDYFKHSDYLNLNIWMAIIGRFYTEIGYSHRFYDNKSYDALKKGEYVYKLKEEQWLQELTQLINEIADYSKKVDKYLITTEGWGPIDYKDYPGLDWGWVKDCCAAGVEAALKTKRWKVICTSNFCGPQFKGMWNDIEWHKKLTKSITIMNK